MLAAEQISVLLYMRNEVAAAELYNILITSYIEMDEVGLTLEIS